MHHTLRLVVRALAVVALLFSLATTPMALASDDEVVEMCFTTGGEDAGIGRLRDQADPRAWVGGTLTGNTNRYWLKFDLSALPVDASAIESATLDLTAGRRSSLALGVALAEDTWSAATLTWANQPAFQPATAVQDYAFETGMHYTWDVTAHVQADLTAGDRTLSLIVMQEPEGSRTGNVWFQTHDQAPSDDARPMLCIRYREQTNTPPVATVGAPIKLWPPNRKMHEFTLGDLVTAFDAEDGVLDPNASGRILDITSDEDTAARECPWRRFCARWCSHWFFERLFGADIDLIDETTFAVRAERDRRGDGRIYIIRFEIVDGDGAATEGEATVVVPKKRKKRRRR